MRKAILNPLGTDFTVARAPASLVNNNGVGLLIERVQDLLRKLQTLLPSFPTVNPEECKASAAAAWKCTGKRGISIKQKMRDEKI